MVLATRELVVAMVMVVSDRAGGNGNGCKYGQFVQIWSIKKEKEDKSPFIYFQFLPKQIKKNKKFWLL